MKVVDGMLKDQYWFWIKVKTTEKLSKNAKMCGKQDFYLIHFSYKFIISKIMILKKKFTKYQKYFYIDLIKN